MSYDLVYIHPTGLDHHSWSPIIPMGVPALMQSVDCKKIGVFYDQVNEELIRSAKIVALDLHWYFHLYPVEVISAYLKRINPSINIIAGGYTATVLAETIIKNFKIDFIIKGDAEYPFVLLVNGLLGNGDIRNIPNIVAKSFSSKQDYCLTKDGFSSYVYNDLSWFPALEKIIHKAQKLKYPSWIGPWIPVSKGCKYQCSFCYGSPFLQEKINKRKIVSRPADKVREDLLKWSRDEKIRYVHFISDFLDSEGSDYAKAVLSAPYDLSVYYEFYNIPSIEEVNLFLNAFKYCHFWFTIKTDHSSGKNLNNFEAMRALFDYLKDKNCRIGLCVQPRQIFRHKDYFKMFASLAIRNKIDLLEYNWDIKVPDPMKDQESEFRNFFNLSKKSDIFPYFKKRSIEIAYGHKAFFSFLMMLGTYSVLVKCLFNFCTQSFKEATKI
ncbi:MAG: hypothetical protein PHW54_00640 [Candidatus Omnitrophica bacterium]|nr:hypothetical protein [Candidatus Omnitrophota bacterium]